MARLIVRHFPEPKGDIHTGIDYIEPANDIEESLLHMWKEVLSISGLERRTISLNLEDIH